ncbi:MAG: PD40 domain-containing protein [Bacteroidetes bacterium]|nr:PD40 domain-containing protein [Bacteroidota bacterium]
MKNIVAVTSEGEFSSPLWSPDGSKILFTTSNFKGLYLISLNSNKVTIINTIDGAGYNAAWSNDSKFIFAESDSQVG